jgi:hypothetical protein
MLKRMLRGSKEMLSRSMHMTQFRLRFRGHIITIMISTRDADNDKIRIVSLRVSD